MKTSEMISGLKRMNKPQLKSALLAVIDKTDPLPTVKKIELMVQVGDMKKPELLETLITIVKELSA